MADYPPYMNAYGVGEKILQKIIEAKTPERFTQDFLGTQLGFKSGSGKAFIPLAKRIGLLDSSGTPTSIYGKFRNKTTSKQAMAEAIRIGYPDVFARNEYAYSLDTSELEGLFKEITGLETGNQILGRIINTFEMLKKFADFEEKNPSGKGDQETLRTKPTTIQKPKGEISLGLSYTINLVLPKSDDIAVFDAIFKSLRENILDK